MTRKLPRVSRPTWPVALFDLDGTCANTIPLIVASYQTTLRDVLGLEVDEITIRSWIGRTLIDTFLDIAPAQAEQLVDYYIAWNLKHMNELIRPYAGMHDLLASLKDAGVTTGIVTAKRRHSAQRSLESLGLEGVIDLITTMEDTVRHKPHADPLVFALDALGRQPHETVYVGDAVVDLRAAAAAGTAGIGVTWGAGVREDLDAEPAHAIVDTVPHLQSLLLP